MELLTKNSPFPGEIEDIPETETRKIELIRLLTLAVRDSNLLFRELPSIVILATGGTSPGRPPQAHKWATLPPPVPFPPPLTGD